MKIMWYIYILLVLFFAKYVVDLIAYALWLIDQKKIRVSRKKSASCLPVISEMPD